MFSLLLTLTYLNLIPFTSKRQGTFGKAVEAVDTTNNAPVAIKIIRAIPKYRDASKIEVRVLQELKEKDPTNKQSVVFCKPLFAISIISN